MCSSILIAIANMDIPAVFAYGGTIAPGNLDGKDIDLVSVFEGIGKWNHGDLTAEEVRRIECNVIAGMGSYYFPDRTFDDKIWLVALYPSLFFIGTTLYVKSVMRERKNPLYLKLSIGFHALCILGFILVEQYLMALAFVPPFIRAIWLPQKKMSVKQVGFTEIGISLLFFANLLYATL